MYFSKPKTNHKQHAQNQINKNKNTDPEKIGWNKYNQREIDRER